MLMLRNMLMMRFGAECVKLGSMEPGARLHARFRLWNRALPELDGPRRPQKCLLVSAPSGVEVQIVVSFLQRLASARKAESGLKISLRAPSAPAWLPKAGRKSCLPTPGLGYLLDKWGKI